MKSLTDCRVAFAFRLNGTLSTIGFTAHKRITPRNGGCVDLAQNSLKASAPCNSVVIKTEIISYNHFPAT
jgi:hypothetical protein